MATKSSRVATAAGYLVMAFGSVIGATGIHDLFNHSLEKYLSAQLPDATPQVQAKAQDIAGKAEVLPLVEGAYFLVVGAGLAFGMRRRGNPNP